MGRIYCTLDDTKRLLRSVGVQSESKVRFSESYKELKADQGNNGSISLSGVSFSKKFAAHETFSFEFTDSTSFDVVGQIVGFLGSGTVLSSFTASNRFSVPAANWSGGALTGDIWYITSDSDISENDGDDFINDACRIINAMLESKYGGLDKVSFYVNPAEEIPPAIIFACIRLSAYEIFNSIYSAAALEENFPVQGWKKSAEKILNNFIESHGQGPVWKSRDSLITELGVDGVGDGVIEIDNLLDSSNKDYDR